MGIFISELGKLLRKLYFFVTSKVPITAVAGMRSGVAVFPCAAPARPVRGYGLGSNGGGRAQFTVERGGACASTILLP
jgi:hypothetical protein